MKKLFWRITFLLIVSLGSIIFLAFGDGNYNHLLSILINKVQILETTPSPKIIFVGGSGLFHGINSARLSRELGVDVVNLGQFAGFGISMYETLIVPQINKGDLVVVIPEYAQFETKNNLEVSHNEARAFSLTVLPITSWPHQYRNGGLLEKTKEFVSDVLFLAGLKMQAILKTLIIRNKVSSDSGFSEYRRYFNKYGDAIADTIYTQNLQGSNEVYITPIDYEKNEKVLCQFRDSVSSRGASFILIPPAVANSWYINNTAFAEQVFEIEKKCGMVIGKPIDFVYSDTLFADSIYHLRDAGRFFRTETLIQLLQEYSGVVPRYGKSITSSGTISPANYDLISGFHQDRIFTQGDAYFYRLDYQVQDKDQYLVIATKGLNPYLSNLQKLNIHLIIDNREISFSHINGSEIWFKIPDDLHYVNQIRIVSNTYCPICLGISNDDRILGIDIDRITFRE